MITCEKYSPKFGGADRSKIGSRTGLGRGRTDDVEVENGK